MIDGMLAVDAHHHMGESTGDKPFLRTLTADELIARMDAHGIDRSVICHFIFPMWEREAYVRGNDLIVQAVQKYPDRLTGMCTVNPKHGEFAVRELRRGLEAGLRGVKLHPAQHGNYPINGAIVDPVMATATEAGVPVVVHTDFNLHCCTPYEVARLAARFPSVTVVALHMGIEPDGLARIPEIAAGVPNLVVESSQTPDMAYHVYVNTVRQMGVERVLFGTDGPVVSVEANLAKLESAERYWGLTREEKRAILGGNAARIFKLA